MRKISIALLAGAGVLFANSAVAADVFTNDVTYLGMNQPNVEQVRLVCDDSGRCYRSRGSRAWLSSRATTIRTTMLPASGTSRGAVTITTSRAPASASARRE